MNSTYNKKLRLNVKAEAAIATEIELSGPLTVKELAEKMGREVSEVIKKVDAFRCYG